MHREHAGSPRSSDWVASVIPGASPGCPPLAGSRPVAPLTRGVTIIFGGGRAWRGEWFLSLPTIILPQLVGRPYHVRPRTYVLLELSPRGSQCLDQAIPLDFGTSLHRICLSRECAPSAPNNVNSFRCKSAESPVAMVPFKWCKKAWAEYGPRSSMKPFATASWTSCLRASLRSPFLSAELPPAIALLQSCTRSPQGD